MSATLVGQKLGKYEITELLGQGGMATVYKGYQRDVDRFVAVKVLPPHPGQSEQFIERFRLEARTIARLQHPHILPLYDYGDEDDVLYLVMAYVDGGSLSDRIRRGPIPMTTVQHWFQQIAGALDYAHRNNVIHRDIKPDNILLDHEGHALLNDFGIVKLIEDGGTVKLTGTGGLVGTPAYMSPEQAQGLSVDNRTDIYSLGIVIFEMLAGKQPFSAETPMQVVLKHITAPIPMLSEFNTKLPPELDPVMQRALAKDPNERYSSAREFYDDFSRVVNGELPLAPSKVQPPTENAAVSASYSPPSSMGASVQPTVLSPQASWNPLILLGGFAIIALLVVAVVALLLNFNRSSTITPFSADLIPTGIPIVVQPSPISSTPNFGRVTYSTSQSAGDTALVVVNGLTLPAAGSRYDAWMYNTATKDTLKLGELKLDPLGDGQLTFASDEMLPVSYNAVLITEDSGDSTTPSGKVAYSGVVPSTVMTALHDILIVSPDGIPAVEATAAPLSGLAQATAQVTAQATDPQATPDSGDRSSLLQGALDEAQIGMKHSGLAAQATTVGSLHTHAEHTINIMNGTYIDYNGNGRGENPGYGYGIDYFTDRIQKDLDSIANAPDSTPQIQSQVDLARVCIVNVHNWMAEVVALETQMLTANDLDAVHPQLVSATQWADAMVNGVDLNGNGQIEPFEGECGLQQISDFGLSVGDITLVAGPLPQGE